MHEELHGMDTRLCWGVGSCSPRHTQQLPGRHWTPRQSRVPCVHSLPRPGLLTREPTTSCVSLLLGIVGFVSVSLRPGWGTGRGQHSPYKGSQKGERVTVLHPSCACKGKSWPAWGGAVRLTAAGVPESHTVCPDLAWNRGRGQKHEHLSLFQQGTPKAASREKGPLRTEAAPGLRLDASGGPGGTCTVPDSIWAWEGSSLRARSLGIFQGSGEGPCAGCGGAGPQAPLPRSHPSLPALPSLPAAPTTP